MITLKLPFALIKNKETKKLYLFLSDELFLCRSKFLTFIFCHSESFLLSQVYWQ